MTLCLASATNCKTLSRSEYDEPMVLPAIAASCVQEDNLLLPFASLLVEDLALPPKRRLDVDVAADNAIVVQLLLCLLGSGAGERVVQEFQDTTPDVGPACESIL
jgi:hypothetical protein